MAERRHRVEWAEIALLDVYQIVTRLAQDSPPAARRVAALFDKRVRSLRRMPGRGRRVPELVALGIHDRRELIAHPYRIVYRIDDRVVWVQGVFDGRRDLQTALFERTIRTDTRDPSRRRLAISAS